jgi:hypothetical protein
VFSAKVKKSGCGENDRSEESVNGWRPLGVDPWILMRKRSPACNKSKNIASYKE